MIARRSTRRMMELVNAILDVSRLESGRMPIEATAFDMVKVVADALQAQTALASEKDIHLENHVPSMLPAAWADRGLIHRVLQNLVGNGIKFTPNGGTVSVTASLDEQAPQPMLLLSVSDTGFGIPPEIQSRLFQKFVTGGQEGRGSGLGLAFCKLAVEAHGGGIWVDSIPDHGTTFAFTVPVAPQGPQ
jgi:signal transduction histidine kinase